MSNTPFGEDTPRIRELSARDIIERMTQGCVVSLHIETPQACLKLTEADLGIVLGEHARAAYGRYYSLGTRHFLPKEWRNQIGAAERNIRTKLEQSSMDMPLIPMTIGGSGSRPRFVPTRSYFTWKAAHEEAVARFFQVRDDLVAHWSEIASCIRADIYTMASDIYRRMTSDSATSQLAEDASLEEQVQYAIAHLRSSSRRTFIDSFVDAALGQIPTRAEVADGFTVTCDLGRILTPSQLVADEARAQTMIRDRLLHDAQLRMEEELRQHEAASRKEVITTFYHSVIGQLNELVAATCSDVLEAIARNGNLRGNAGGKHLRTLIEKLEAMNVMDDAAITHQIAELRQALSTYEKGKGGTPPVDLANMDRVLREVRGQSQAVLVAITQSGGDRLVRTSDFVRGTPQAVTRLVRDVPTAQPSSEKEGERLLRAV